MRELKGPDFLYGEAGPADPKLDGLLEWTMRTLTDHIVDGDSVNHQVTITVMDEPGQGGANHEYEISYPGGIGLNAQGHNAVGQVVHRVSFQNGPIKMVGVNGITGEALLAIEIDRLRSFQAGPYASPENGAALSDCISALTWLQERTRKRIARGVEATHAR